MIIRDRNFMWTNISYVKTYWGVNCVTYVVTYSNWLAHLATYCGIVVGKQTIQQGDWKRAGTDKH